MGWYPVRRCVYGHSDYQLAVWGDWIPLFLVRRRVYARSDCPLHWSADCVNLSVVADALGNTGYSDVSQNITLIFGSDENGSTYIKFCEEEEFGWFSCFLYD